MPGFRPDNYVARYSMMRALHKTILCRLYPVRSAGDFKVTVAQQLAGRIVHIVRWTILLLATIGKFSSAQITFNNNLCNRHISTGKAHTHTKRN